MAITASGLFYPTYRDVLDTSQSALDLDLETHKGALFTDSLAPNFSTDTVYGAGSYSSNETSGGSWSAGGIALTGTTVSESPTGSLMFDATDVSVGTTTITNAMCYVLYADAQSDLLICLVDFVTAYSTSNGTFGIQWAVAGVFAIDLTP